MWVVRKSYTIVWSKWNKGKERPNIHWIFFLYSDLCSVKSVAQLCLTLWDPMDCSMPGFPVHHQLPEPTQIMSIESVMPFNHSVLCDLLLLPSIFPSIRVFYEAVLHIRWPKFWNFSFSISPSNEYPELISFMID